MVLTILLKNTRKNKIIIVFIWIENNRKEKPQQKETIQVSELQKIDKSAQSNVEFNCLTATKSGFIVGGNKGCLSLYNLGRK